MTRLLMILFVCALSACAVPIDIPKEVKVRVAIACVDPDTRPKRPELRIEPDMMGMDRYRRTLATWSDLKKYELYTAELEAVVEGCSRIPGVNPPPGAGASPPSR